MKSNSVRNQYYATFCVNILSMAYGTTCGWLSPSILVLQSVNTPLESGELSNFEASWVGSILCIGGFIGNHAYGWLSEKIGRKVSLLLVGFPLLAGWIFIILATNVTHLCIGRFLGGLAGGGAFAIIPLYITEISEDSTRGALGSFLVFSANIGLLLAFILGHFLSYYTVLYILLCFPVLFMIFVVTLPETPQHLLKNKKEKEAEIALRYFRNLKLETEMFKAEMEKLRRNYLEDDKQSDDHSLSVNDFTNRVALRACVIGVALMALNQFCGCFAMINYTASIFKQAGSNLSPNVSAIIIGVIQLIGAYFSTLLVERAGRKLLITASAFGAGVGLFVFGLYLTLEAMGYDVSAFKWIPLASFAFVIFIGSFGVLTLPFLVLSEIMPPKIRSVASIWCMNLMWIFAFLMVKFYPILSQLVGISTCMFFFSACCLSGAVFVMVFVPETKGKSLDTILALLNK